MDKIKCSNNIFYDISNSDITFSGAAMSEPTNCTTTDGALLEQGTVYVDAGANLVGGGGGGGGGGGSLSPWLLALLGIFLTMRYGASVRRSV